MYKKLNLHTLTPFTKINSKCDIYLNKNAIKLLEDNIGGNLSLAMIFFRCNTKSISHKQNINKLDFIKI